MIMPVLIEFVRMISIHEKSREVIKRKGLFRIIVEPVVQDGKPNYESNLSMVIQSCSIPANNPLSFPQMPEILRNSDTYFLDIAKEVLPQNIKYCQEKALILQREFYSHMTQCLKPGPDGRLKSKRQFQLEVQEKLRGMPEYFILKFEVDRIFSMYYTPFHDIRDSMVVMQYIWKLFTQPVIEEFFNLFEIVATIKPVFESMKSGFHDISRPLLNVFYNMFTNLISVHRSQQHNLERVELFEKRLRQVCRNLA